MVLDWDTCSQMEVGGLCCNCGGLREPKGSGATQGGKTCQIKLKDATSALIK